MPSINIKIVLFIIILGADAFCSNSAHATTWYVRDGGGNPTQCNGMANAVYLGSGNNQPCALSNPMYVLGEGCGNTGGNTCDVPGVMQDGDTLYIVGDSDLNPGQQAQYPIGLDVNGIVTPVNSANCYAPAPENCTMGNMPPNSSIIGIGTNRPQLWGREHIAQVLNDNNSSLTVIDNLEITQHSACVYNGANPAGTTDGFPNACHTSDNNFSSPYGDWGLAGISLTGSGITLENNWIHGMAQWGVSTGSLTNLTEANNIINGNGGGGMGLGQNISNAGTMTLGGTTTVNGEIIVYNGCGSTYPLHSTNPFDTLNYHNCADDSSSNGTILADGWAMEAGSGICTNVTISNSIIAYNTKGGIDNLHCNGSGTFNAYRVRVEGNESQQMKLNYGTVNVENSQIINDCNYFEGQPFTTTCDSNGNCPPALGNDFCRAAGDGLRIALNNGNVYNISDSTFYSDGGANIEFPQSTCNGAVVNINNNLVINAADYTNGDSQNTDFYENDTGSCSPVVENYNLVYQPNDLSNCAGKNDICNPANAGVAGNFALNSSFTYTNAGLADQFYPASNSPLIGAANSRLVLTGTSNDYNNYSRSSSSWDIGSYQNGSSVANGSVCFSNGECSSNNCSNNFCAAAGSTSSPGSGGSGGSTPPASSAGPIVAITSPVNASTFASGTSISITATASETNGNIVQVTFYDNSTNLLSTSTTAPYQYTAVNLAVGNHSLTAVATDGNGLSTTSGPIDITVTSPVSQSTPVVTITNPTNASTFTAASNITLTATASESNGTITKVQFFNGTAPLAYTGTNAPYTYTWQDVQPGTYTMTAQATDSNGVVAISAPITIIVNSSASASNPPTVVLTSPASGSTYSGGSNINLTASASETNGTIAQVQFFDGTAPLAYTGTSAPYNYAWNNVQPGTYTMTAQATDSNGVTVQSAPITITVNASTPVTSPPLTTPPVTTPPVTTPPATTTPAPTANSGTVSITSPGNNTSYTVPAAILLSANASENGGSIIRVDYYAGSIYLGEATSSPYAVTWTSAQAGTYSLTAKATDSSGVPFYSAPVNITVNAHTPPTVAITAPVNNTDYNIPANITLTANATASGGSITKVDFYSGTLYLGTAYSSPYTINWNDIQTGNFSLTAKATDSYGWSSVSSAINILVADVNQLPVSVSPTSTNAPAVSNSLPPVPTDNSTPPATTSPVTPDSSDTVLTSNTTIDNSDQTEDGSATNSADTSGDVLTSDTSSDSSTPGHKHHSGNDKNSDADSSTVDTNSDTNSDSTNVLSSS